MWLCQKQEVNPIRSIFARALLSAADTVAVTTLVLMRPSRAVLYVNVSHKVRIKGLAVQR